MSGPGERSGGGPRRAQSELIGVIALVAFVAIVATGVLFVAFSFQKDVGKSGRMDSVEQSMENLDSKLEALSMQSKSNESEFQLSGDGTVTVRRGSDVTTVNVYLNDPTNPNCKASITPGAIQYALDGQRVVYEAGGIWRIPKQGDPVMVSPPDLKYENHTIRFTPPKVESTGSISTGKNRVQHDYRATQRQSNQLENDLVSPGADPSDPCRPRTDVHLRVKTPFYDTWKTYLNETFPANVTPTVSGSGDVRTVKADLNGSHLRDFDSDDDGVADKRDNCPRHFNPRQSNEDLYNPQGTTAANEESWAANESGEPDSKRPRGGVCDSDDDGDGIADDRNASASGGGDGFVKPGYFDQSNVGGPTNSGTLDNCPKTYNPDQLNQDGDSFGDACDPDEDGDGVRNQQDVCSKEYNPRDSSMYRYARELPGSDPDGQTDTNVPANDTDDGNVVDAYERNDDEVPNACDPDDDGDEVPDFGYYYSETYDQYAFNGTLYRDPAGEHPKPFDSARSDNCPKEPNSDQANFDRHEGDVRKDNGTHAARDDRGDVCDQDADDDTIKDNHEWDAAGDDPCLFDVNRLSTDGMPNPASVIDTDSRSPAGSSIAFEEPNTHTGDHKADNSNFDHGSGGGSATRTITKPKCKGWDNSTSPPTCTGGYKKKCTNWNNSSEHDPPGPDCVGSWVNETVTETTNVTDIPGGSAQGEPHGSAVKDSGDQVLERCEADDKVFNNSQNNTQNRRGNDSSSDDLKFDPGPMCNPAATPEWSSVSGSPAAVHSSTSDGCYPNEPPARFTVPSEPAPRTRVVRIGVKVVVVGND